MIYYGEYDILIWLNTILLTGAVILLGIIKKNKQLFLFGLFFILSFLYFFTQYINTEYHSIYSRLDSYIPFMPIFILPYIVWYVYVPLPMIYTCFKNKSLFFKQITALFLGAAISIIIFIIYPTKIDFRPSVDGGGFLNYLCRLIYANDKPVNVFPSLHAYEATIIHLITFKNTEYKNLYLLRACSAVIMVFICLSTVFVKQHSVIDLFAGCILAVLVYFVVNFIFDSKFKRKVI